MSQASSPAREDASPPQRSKFRRNLAPILRTFPFFRPYLAIYSLVVVFTLLGAAAEGGQAYLIQPLLNRVLLRGGADDAEKEDREWLEEHPTSAHDPALVGARSEAESLAADWTSLIDYDGRRSAPNWREDPLCRLLGRSRRQLENVRAQVEAEASVAPTASADLTQALALQLVAQRVLDDPTEATPQARALAGQLAFESRGAARDVSFALAWATLKWILLAALGLAALLGISRFVSTAVARIVVTRVFRDVQDAIVARIVTLSASQLLGARRGDLIARMTQDLARAVNGVIKPLFSDVLLQPLRLLALYGVALWVSWQLSLGLLVLGLSVLYPIRRWGKLIRRSARRRQGALADVVETLHQLFDGMRLVKAFRREEYEKTRFRSRTEEAYTAEVEVIKARITSRTWLRLVNDITIPITILLGGYLIANGLGGLDVGQFAAFTGLTIFMYRPTRAMAMAYNMLQDNLHSLKRVLEVLDYQPEIVDLPDAQPLDALREEIRCEGVGYRFDEVNWVLRDVSFTAPVGTTTAIVGRTGAGKSTLMNLLLRFLDPSEGRVLADGRPLQTILLASWRARLALVSQNAFVFNASVRENLRYGRLVATDEEIEAAARQARIHEEIVGKPEGYDYNVGEHGSKLSGGQVQRLTLARAILRRPDLLLLDEATSALDTQTERQIQEAIKEVGCTTFVIAHRLSTVRHADQILVLDQGRLVERGSHEDLLERDGVYADLVHTLVKDED